MNKGVRRGFGRSGTLDAVDALSAITGGGYAVIIPPFGFDAAGSTGLNTASRADLMQIYVPVPMVLRSLTIRTTIGNSGTVRWALFTAANDPTAATKVVGGSGAIATGFSSIPVDGGGTFPLPPGYYSLIFMNAASSAPTVGYQSTGTSTGHTINRAITSYTWTDTPDLTSGAGWGNTIVNLSCFLVGDYDQQGHQH